MENFVFIIIMLVNPFVAGLMTQHYYHSCFSIIFSHFFHLQEQSSQLLTAAAAAAEQISPLML